MYSVQDYEESFDLFDYIIDGNRTGGGIPESIIRNIFLQVLRGVNHLHSNGVCHRDLKLENILLVKKDCSIKLIDFGFVGPVAGRDKCGKLTTFVGTQVYMAPELLSGNISDGYNGQACDIFALGIILFVLTVQ